SLVAAVPGGYLCYLLGAALALPTSDLWKKPLLGGAVVGTGLLVLLAAVVWPLLYAVAFYDDPNKSKKTAEGEEDAAVEELEEDKPKTPRAETFEEEDVDVFEREGVTAEAEEASDDDEFESASEGSEFDVEEDSIDQAETADFDLGDDDFADLEMEEEVEEEEESPKKKAKKKKK
ncbi:MAG: hypothetical protein IAG10_33055, partial [Planctomycetaceae bacterium]|nr:hypothetical protein [Planctomycetaceae bacterium]